MHLQKTPVHTLAESLGLPVLTPARARDPEFIEQLRALAPNLIVLASYGKILPQAVLEIAPLGNWNLHASLLPKYRGASPIQYALLNGERETGVTLMEMVAEMDAGDIYLQATEPIHPDDDYGTLEARLAERAASLLLEGLERLQAGTLTRTPQDHTAATYAPLIAKDDARIRWEEPAERCRNRIRAFSPKPGAFTLWRGKTLKLWKAEVAPRTEDAAPGDNHRLRARRFSRCLRARRAAPAGGAARKPLAHGDPRVPQRLPPASGRTAGLTYCATHAG
jgi:methionyl-tRNA formyltransferase